MVGFVLTNVQWYGLAYTEQFYCLTIPLLPAIHPLLPAPELLADTDGFPTHTVLFLPK